MVSDKWDFGLAFRDRDSDRLIIHLSLIWQTNAYKQKALKGTSGACSPSNVSFHIARLRGGRRIIQLNDPFLSIISSSTGSQNLKFFIYSISEY
jgi:hypothetical protein